MHWQGVKAGNKEGGVSSFGEPVAELLQQSSTELCREISQQVGVHMIRSPFAHYCIVDNRSVRWCRRLLDF